ELMPMPVSATLTTILWPPFASVVSAPRQLAIAPGSLSWPTSGAISARNVTLPPRGVYLRPL
ncbi:MAG: hypothetical protein ACRDHE_08480, partial [Ktedonobacterales bacterium]